MGPTKGTHTSTSANTGYTMGGDRTIRSSDNVDFKVHSVILSLASPVLSDLLSSHDPGNVVTLSETAEAVKLLLDFVYPRPPPTINSFEMLNHGLLVAEKYQLDDMKERLRSMLFLQGSPVSVFENPLMAVGVATAHMFEKEAEFAASLVVKSGDTMPNDILKLVIATPSISPLVKVVGAALGRNAILADVLFKFHEPPMTWVGQHCYDFLCATCREIYYNQKRYSAPEWLARWAYRAFQVLISRPISQWDTVFTYEFYQIALSQGAIPVPRDSCGCFKRYASNEERFEKWAAGVRKELEKRLGELDVLDLLKRSQLAPRRQMLH